MGLNLVYGTTGVGGGGQETKCGDHRMGDEIRLERIGAQHDLQLRIS